MSEQKRPLPPTSLDRSPHLQQLTFSQRAQSGDLKVDQSSCSDVASKMLSELNAFSGRILVLLHKIVEVIKTEPRCFTEYLRLDYEQRIKEKNNEFIFR